MEVTPSTYTFVTLGDTARFSAAMRDASGAPVSVERFQWSSSDESVATVDTTGLATAVGPGPATIRAEAHGVRGSAELAVEVFPSVSAGFTHTCVVAIGGDAYCWGRNDLGQLGDGTTTDRHTPVPVSGGLSFVEVSAGGLHTCGVTTGGSAYCWGFNRDGQLGDGTTTDRHAPGLVSGGAGFVMLSAGTHYTCGVKTGGVAYCWGLNSDGQLGDGTQTGRTMPVPVSGELSFAALSAGEAHVCGLTTPPHAGADYGLAYCWGLNVNGQLGDSTRIDRLTPVPVYTFPYPWVTAAIFASLSAGGHHTCGEYNGWARCWGLNISGQLGGQYGDVFVPEWLVPAQVWAPASSTLLSAGGHHTCGVMTGGNGYCWGNNSDGQLGIGPGSSRAWGYPRKVVAPGLQLVAVSAGEAHTCGVTTRGEVYCWGRNDHGQLGDGTTTNRSEPAGVVW